MMIDIDCFKKINDAYGHTVGDDVLKLIAQVLRSRLRSSDVVGRYGGEEFAVVLPDANLAQGQQVAERLRQVVGQPAAAVTPLRPAASADAGIEPAAGSRTAAYS